MSDLLSEAEALPEKPPRRSKLEPFAEVILALRRKRYSYQEIAGFLLKKAMIEVDPSSVWDFVQAQKKRKRHDKENIRAAVETPAPGPEPAVTGPKRNRKVYVPPARTTTTFDPASLKTNDQVDDG
jgi:IS30 family transposase